MSKIRDIRRSKNITQRKLAEQLGVSTALISRYESGEITPPNDKLRKIAEILAVPVTNLEDNPSNFFESLIKQHDEEGERSRRRHSAPVPQEQAVSSLLSFFDNVGYTYEKVFLNDASDRSYPFSLKVVYDNKIWIISILTDLIPPFSLLGTEDIYREIGRASTVKGINKYSMITVCAVDSLLGGISPDQCSSQLRFDFSILHYSAESSSLDYEVCLSSNYCGGGFFDLEVPGKEASSALQLARWKRFLDTSA